MPLLFVSSLTPARTIPSPQTLSDSKRGKYFGSLLWYGCMQDVVWREEKRTEWISIQNLFYFSFGRFKEELLRTPAEILPLLAFYYAVSFINEAKLLSISGSIQH
jgi:hypothetical protein